MIRFGMKQLISVALVIRKICFCTENFIAAETNDARRCFQINSLIGKNQKLSFGLVRRLNF